MQHKQSPLKKDLQKKKKISRLVLFNDDVNTFDHVIDSLIIYCNHTEEQAEQCAWITHLKGKCTVKEGEYEELKSMATALSEEGLSIEIY